MLAPALALGASVSWGVGDFLGGLKSRVLAPLAVMAVAQPVGLTLLAIAVPARARAAFSGARRRLGSERCGARLSGMSRNPLRPTPVYSLRKGGDECFCS